MGDDKNYTTPQNPTTDYSKSQKPGTGNTSTPQNKVFNLKAVVGEKILIDSSFVLMFQVQKVKWVLPDPATAIKNYIHDFKGGEVIQLNSTDETRKKLEFFWVKAGSYSIKGRITYNWAGYLIDVDCEFKYDVDSPKFIKLEAVTTKPTLVPLTKTDSALQFKEGKKPGIMWKWAIELPKTSDGYVKDLQTVKPGGRIKIQKIGKNPRKIVYRNEHGSFPILDDKRIEGKDGRTPAYEIILVNDPELHVAGKRVDYEGVSDSPGGVLEPVDQKVTVNEEFKYWVMFKAAKENSIWVPVGKMEWYWMAEAQRVGRNWKLKNEKGGISLKGEASNEFPLYKGDGNSHQWLDPL